MRLRSWLALAVGAAVLVPIAAYAAQKSGKTPGLDEAILVSQIVLLVLAGRGLGELMIRIGQPGIVGQLLAGILLGPSVFGVLWPSAHDLIFPQSPEQKAMITAIAQFGILFLLVLTGMETDLKLVRRTRGTAIAVSLTGIAVPFVCGFVLGQYLPTSLVSADHRLVSSLFLGTALSISSIKIVAGVVREMNFMRRDLGQVIVASAIFEDSIGWIIIAITFGIAREGRIDTLTLLRSVGGVGLFLLASFTVGQYLVFRIIRWANDTLRSDFAVVTVIILIMGVMSLITYALGVQTVLGAFVAGVLIGQSPILTRHIEEQLRGLVSALFMPVFFCQAGISADLSVLGQPQLLGMTAVIIAIASLGKFGGAFLGGRISGLTRRESFAIGCGMNARGSTEVIVATIGLSMAVLSQNLYTMIVAMAVATTMAMPPMLRAALRKLPLGKEEKARLEREEIDARGFVANLERMLLAVDRSSAGKFASRLAGYIAGVRGMPLTVVHVDGKGSAPPGESDSHRQEIKAGAKDSAAAATTADEGKPRQVDITAQVVERLDSAETVADFSRKGFDFLFVGIEAARTPEGSFAARITKLIDGFEGPLAVLVSSEKDEAVSLDRILVPVSGSEVSRRGAEVAMVIARAAGARATALYVAPASAARVRRSSLRRSEEAVLKDVAQLASRYDLDIASQIETHDLAEAPILREAMKRHDLIVMGVSRRPGDVLFFGNTAAALMKKWKGWILFVAS